MGMETKYYGIHACLELAKRRSCDIIRVYVDSTNVKTFGPVLKWCAANRKAYHIVPMEDLAKITDSVHHEGVCILAKEPKMLGAEEFLKKLPQKGCLLYLDGVENPNNFGSILRTAAHFGVTHILGEKLPLTASACRIAKGGAEFVEFVIVKQPEILATLEKRGFAFISTSSHKGESLYKFSFPPRSIIAIGAESTGLNPKLLKHSTHSIRITGTNAVESLNVSIATALCLGEYFRQHG